MLCRIHELVGWAIDASNSDNFCRFSFALFVLLQVVTVGLEEEIQDSFMQYAMSIILVSPTERHGFLEAGRRVL